MRCPKCASNDDKVIETRISKEGDEWVIALLLHEGKCCSLLFNMLLHLFHLCLRLFIGMINLLHLLLINFLMFGEIPFYLL